MIKFRVGPRTYSDSRKIPAFEKSHLNFIFNDFSFLVDITRKVMSDSLKILFY